MGAKIIRTRPKERAAERLKLKKKREVSRVAMSKRTGNIREEN